MSKITLSSISFFIAVVNPSVDNLYSIARETHAKEARRAPKKQEDVGLQEQARILKTDDIADFDSDEESTRPLCQENATNSDNRQLTSSFRPAASRQDDEVVVIDNDIGGGKGNQQPLSRRSAVKVLSNSVVNEIIVIDD
jgi:hypothetical protein